MDLKTAIERLANAAHQGTGASAGAATVLLFGWNAAHPMRGLLSLDEKNRAAALVLIEAALAGRLNGGKVVEDIVGYKAMNAFAKEYGNRGTAWES